MKRRGLLRKWKLQFYYFKRTGFYNEVGKSLINFILLIADVIGLILLAEETIIDIEEISKERYYELLD
mgnify:CR=1 FL=1